MCVLDKLDELLLQVLNEIARIMLQADAFGSKCSLKQVLEELQKTSDFEINALCEQYEEMFPRLAELKLPEHMLFESGRVEVMIGRACLHVVEGRTIMW